MKSPQLEFITIGRILAPWGSEGKLKVEPITDFPERFAPHSEVYIRHQPMTVDSTEWRRGKVVIKLGTIDSIGQAQKLCSELVEVPHSQLHPLPEGEYYLFQLVGLEVWTTQGERLGSITEILATGSNDNYVVSGTRGKILIPAIEDVVKSVDLEQGRMLIEPMAGLLDLNQRASV
jgi:16S rRNA processing protein RimM